MDKPLAGWLGRLWARVLLALYRVGVVGAVGVVGLTGCAATRPPVLPAHELLHDAAFGPPAAITRPEDVLAITPEMRAYLQSQVAPEIRRKGTQRGLFDALYSKQQLRLEYDAERTRTAAEAFDGRAGNCLSLALMTGAFAKELHLNVRFQTVEVDDSWERSGDLVLHHGHVNVSLGRAMSVAQTTYGPEWFTIDFIPVPNIERAHINVIDETRVVAMYLNNRAAESLAGDHDSEAYWWARAAVLHDPAYADAYNTLGVVYRRRGELAWAEAAMRRTLALDTRNLNAIGNLASVLKLQGRETEGLAMAALLKRLQPAPPFQYYERGLQALRAGDYRLARELLEKELPRSNGHHLVHLGLAAAYLNLGNTDAAARHLKLAAENSTTRQQQAVYAAKLAQLKTAGMH